MPSRVRFEGPQLSFDQNEMKMQLLTASCGRRKVTHGRTGDVRDVPSTHYLKFCTSLFWSCMQECEDSRRWSKRIAQRSTVHLTG